jgi:hypothetical protein
MGVRDVHLLHAGYDRFGPKSSRFGARRGGGMFRRWMVTLALVVVAGIAACGSGDGAGTGDERSPEDGGLQTELVYVRSGGLAGETVELTIQPDGGAEVDGASFTLSAEELDAVVAALGESDFEELPADATGDPVPDAYSHRITYGDHEVETVDLSVPPELEALLSELQSIVEANQPG